jgi:hypothetical protein
MATIYVNATGSNTSPYDTWAKAATAIATAVTYGEGVAGPHTLNIADGTYDEYVIFSNANWVDGVVNGASTAGTIVASAGTHCVLVDNAGMTLNNLTMQSTTTKNSLYITNAVTVNDCILSGDTTGALVLQGGDGSIFNRCRFRSSYTLGSYAFDFNENTTLNYCIFESYVIGGSANLVALRTAHTATLNNCLLLDSGDDGILANNGTLNIYNSIAQAGNVNGTVRVPVRRAGGTVNLYNNFLIQNLRFTGETVGTINTANNITSDSPKFVASSKYSAIIPRVDDANNFAYAQSVAAILPTYGSKGTYFLQQDIWNTANNAALRTMVSNGVMEVGSHSYSHSSLELADGDKIFDVTKGAETITIDRTAGTITLSGGGSVTGFKTKTLAQIKTGLEALGATVTGTAIYVAGSPTTGTIGQGTLGEVIKAGVAANEIDLLVDATAASGYYKTEISDPKTWLATTIINGAGNVTDPQTGVTYVCRSFGSPFNKYDADANTAMIAAGYAQGGANQLDTSFGNSLNAYAVTSVSMAYLKGDGTEAIVRKNARELAFSVAQSGIVVMMLAHSTTDLTIAQWEYALDEWQKSGANVTSFQSVMDHVRAGSWTDNLDGTFSRTYATYNDYHLQAGSPAINAGVDVGLTSDIDGKMVPSSGTAVDIGAYEYQGEGAGSIPGTPSIGGIPSIGGHR